jgi:hypothetical protein
MPKLVADARVYFNITQLVEVDLKMGSVLTVRGRLTSLDSIKSICLNMPRLGYVMLDFSDFFKIIIEF